jgi:hypothetical protein
MKPSLAMMALIAATPPACSSSTGGGGNGCGFASGDGGSCDVVNWFGLAVGARWTYNDHNYGDDTDITTVKEITGCEQVMFFDGVTGEQRQYNAYVQQTTGGTYAADDARKQYLVANGDGLVRVKQDFVCGNTPETQHCNPDTDSYVTYSPYFMRLPCGPYTQDQTCTYSHERFEYFTPRPDQPTPPTPPETDFLGNHCKRATREYTHEVVNPNDSVTVPAGSYTGVLHMRRTNTGGNNDVEENWFASGVGHVQQEKRNSVAGGGALTSDEKLVDFTAGSGTCE